MRTITDKPTYIISDELAINQENWDAPHHLALGQLSMEKLFKTVAIESKASRSELIFSNSPLNVEQLLFEDPLMASRQLSGEQLLNRRIYNDALLVMHKGEVLHESYRNGMQATDRHVIHSCTKSVCAMIVAITIEKGLLDRDTEISNYLPEFSKLPSWQGVTLQHVLDMQAGIEYNEDYTDPHAQYWSYARAAGYYPPLKGEKAIGAKAWAIENLVNRVEQPGTTFVYNSCLANVLGMALERVYQQDLAAIFEQYLYQDVGAEAAGYFNTDPQGFAITEGQLNLRLRDFARVAALMINAGKNTLGKQVIPKGFIENLVVADTKYQKAYQATTPDSIFKNGQYKNQFWVLSAEQKQFSMLGIHGQFAWFDLKRNLMIVGMGSYPIQDGNLMMRSLNTLWQGIAKAID